MCQKINNYTKHGIVRSWFDRDSYDKYDHRARSIVKQFMEARGWGVEDNDLNDCQQPDVLATKNNRQVYIEAEMKNKKNWSKIEQDGYIQIPARKMDYIPGSGEKLFVHCMVCSDEKEIYLTPQLAFYGIGFDKNRNGCWLHCRKCKQVDPDGKIKDRGNDTFMCIPYKYLSLYKIVDEKWIKFKQPEKVPYDYKTCRR